MALDKRFTMMRCCFIPRNKRDINAITHIIEYCDDISNAVNDFGRDIDEFEKNKRINSLFGNGVFCGGTG